MRIPLSGTRRAFWIALTLALVLLDRAADAAEIDVQYLGGSDYNNPTDWSPQVVPNNGNGGNTYRVTIDPENRSGPQAHTDVTVDALTLKNLGSLSVTDHSFS